MNSLKAMYGCGLNFFIKLAYNSLFLYKFAIERNKRRRALKRRCLINRYIHGTILFA